MPKKDHLYLRLALDLAIMTIRDDALSVLLVERANKPFEGRLALPGGFLREGEDLPVAARRELAEETALDGNLLHLEQLATYGDPDRDPRGRVVSVAYLAIAPDLPVPTAGSDARTAQWVAADTVEGKLAFDHNSILADAVERVRRRIEDTTLATVFCGQSFTIGELRHVYEVVWGEPVDLRNFSRKVLNTPDFVVATNDTRSQETGRPAKLYRRGQAERLLPPMLRSAKRQ